MLRAVKAIIGLLLLAVPEAVVCAQTTRDSNGAPRVDPIYEGLPPPPNAMQSFYDRFDQGQKNLDAADDPHRLATPVSRSVRVTLTPGAQTNIIRIAQDYPAAITFLDETGQPWPIAWNIATNKSGGCDPHGQGQNSAVRTVGINACVPEAGSNVLQLTPISRYAHGGILVNLKDAPKPISFMIISGTGAYDADLTVRVAARGPNAKDMPNLEPNAPVTGDRNLDDMLDGTPPADAVPLLVSGVSPDRIRAWKLGNKMYLRTDYMPISPAPSAHESEYGIGIYEIPETSKVLLSSGARIISVTLSEDLP
ncbi:MAG: DotH/IcmK family type IV secretion protein [Acetobacter sp.]|jgi:intracellular multiplication protein IcmK|nr:DotH/IcmK family type IV secretion protein [Acetobacter sp.]MCI1485848.1 DotH/IcmK family type IV secretion protein [Acetobacter sp.]MCI1529770.1 DotH/IcmK family type IV secretion protein [Acetobacter sp.]MCI1587561.1 DotH/IcmK family type IV secretion protein [Acetobacter sp.]MCI1601778.1 DotH/IcmK family type IV secretion protein [Acetobacter sp.]